MCLNFVATPSDALIRQGSARGQTSPILTVVFPLDYAMLSLRMATLKRDYWAMLSLRIAGGKPTPTSVPSPSR